MNADLTQLRNDLQVQATDADKKGSKNSELRWENINKNLDYPILYKLVYNWGFRAFRLKYLVTVSNYIIHFEAEDPTFE